MRTLALALLLLGSSTLLAGNPNKWEKVDDDDGITVLARDVPGSNIREVKASATAKADAKRIWEVLSNTKEYPKFMPYIEEIRVVGTHPNGHYEYQRIDPPLVDERDYTVKVTLEADEAAGIYKRSWVPANDKGPALRGDIVRVQINEGVWTIKRVGPNQSTISYYLYTDPGGSIPTWIANKANRTSVPALLNAVRQRAADPNWTP